MKQEHKLNLIFVISLTIMLTVMFSLILTTPGAFLYIELGRYLGPILPLVLFVSIAVAAYFVSKKAPLYFTRLMKEDEYGEFLKGRRKKEIVLLLVGLCLSFFITSCFYLSFVSGASQNTDKIAVFVSENTNKTLADYNGNLTAFLNTNLKPSYNKPEMIYKVSEGLVCYGYFSSWMLNKSNINQADVILFHGWGACGEAAIVLEQVMHESGFITRLAEFKGVDHEWAEIKNGTQWLIVDPWNHINLVKIQDLKDVNSEFYQAKGIQVQNYGNSTWVDASKEYGY
jgi:hypothetical protein